MSNRLPPASIILESLPLSTRERYNICVVPPASTGGVSKILVACSPTRVHIADVKQSNIHPISPTHDSSLTAQSSWKAAAQFKTLHFDSEVMFVGSGIGVATVVCRDGQVILLTGIDLEKRQRIGEHRGVLVALLCENNSKVLTCGLLEPPKLFSLNELADTSDGDEYNHQSMNRAAPSSIVHLNDFDGFAPPTSILEWNGGYLVADQTGHVRWWFRSDELPKEVALLGEPVIALLEVSNSIPEVQADDAGTVSTTIDSSSSSVLIVCSSGSLLMVKRRKGTGFEVTAFPSLCISVTSACIFIRGARKNHELIEEQLIVLSQRRVFCVQFSQILQAKINLQRIELSLVPISHPILAMCTTITELLGLGIPMSSNLLLLSSDGCVLSFPWANAAEPNAAVTAAAHYVDTESTSNAMLVQEEIRRQVKETLLRLPLVSDARAALEVERSSVGNAIAALRSLAEALFAAQMDRGNDGLVVKVKWKLNDRKMAWDVREGSGDIEVASELSLTLPEATAAAIAVANKNSTLNLSWVHHVSITSEEPGKTGRAWAVSAPIDTGVGISYSVVLLPFTPSSLHPFYVMSWVELHWREEGFNAILGTDEKQADAHPGVCFTPTPPGKHLDILDWPRGTKIDSIQASAARLLAQPLLSRPTVQQHTFTVHLMLPPNDNNGSDGTRIAVMNDISLTLLGGKAIKEVEGIFRTSLLIAGEKATVHIRPLPSDLTSKSQMVSTIAVSGTCTNASLAAAVRQAVVQRAWNMGCHVKVQERASSRALLDDDLHFMLSQGRLVEVYKALRQERC